MITARSVAALTDDLHRLGVRRGDLLMVHASLRAIGPVDQRADGVIRALEAAVGPDGTLLMVMGADERVQPFDARTTPVDPEVGTLAEVFRTLPGTVVTDHPDGRFGARGARTRTLLADPPWDDYFGPGSALDRLARSGGRVLRLGADPDTVTLLHLAEYLADVPDKRRVSRHHQVRDVDGAVRAREVSCLDDAEGIIDWPGEDYFATILRDFLATHRAGTGMVGDARSELVDAADLLVFATRWMSDRFSSR